MKIANIFPIKNQVHYKSEQFVMILAHLLEQKLYDVSNFNKKDQYVILDNGLFEGAKVSNDLLAIINLAESCNIKVNEIVIPDSMRNMQETVQLFINNLGVIEAWQYKYKFMFVIQAANVAEFNQMMNYINSERFDKYNLSIGIPKKCIIPRDSEYAITSYGQCKHPIHLLGIKDTFKELLALKYYVRSCDSSQLAFIAKNVANIEELDVVAYKRVGVDINLLTDKVNNKKLKKLLNSQKEAFKTYGLL